MTDQEKHGPAMKFKRGSIEAAVFENHRDGKTWHNVSISRRYKNSSGEFRSASTYAYADLVQVARIAEQAEQWIAARLEELGTSAPQSGHDDVNL
jgi:hypothetical protein